MHTGFSTKIRNDLNESQINWRDIVSFRPIAFITFLLQDN